MADYEFCREVSIVHLAKSRNESRLWYIFVGISYVFVNKIVVTSKFPRSSDF